MFILAGCGDHPPLGNGSYTLSHDNGYGSEAEYSCIQNFYPDYYWNRCNGEAWSRTFPICHSMFDFTCI